MTWPTDNLLLADKSAWARVAHYPEEWLAALAADRLVICAVVHLELMYSARTAPDVVQVDQELSGLRDMAISRGALAAAKRALVDLAARGAHGYHRVSPADAIIAACAADHACAVLHYDAHYDRLTEVLAFESVWAAPRGEIP